MGVLDSVLGGSSRTSGGMSPITMALIGLLAYRTFQGKGRLADMLGTKAGRSGGRKSIHGNTGASKTGEAHLPPDQAAAGSATGWAACSAVARRRHPQRRSQRPAQAVPDCMDGGDKVKSWIETGPNKPISPGELEQALGAERIEWLARETGMSRSGIACRPEL